MRAEILGFWAIFASNQRGSVIYHSRQNLISVQGGKYGAGILCYACYYGWRFQGSIRGTNGLFIAWMICASISSFYATAWVSPALEQRTQPTPHRISLWIGLSSSVGLDTHSYERISFIRTKFGSVTCLPSLALLFLLTIHRHTTLP